MEDRQNMIRKLAIIGGVAVFALIIILYSVAKINEVSTGLRLMLVPDGVSLVIYRHGEQTKPVVNRITNFNDAIKLSPGKYDLYFSRADFRAGQQKAITVNDGQVTDVYLVMEAANNTGRDLLETELMSSRAEGITGMEANRLAKEESDKYPFLDKLPIGYKYFEINLCQGLDNQQVTGFCVTLYMDNDVQRADAIREINYLGTEARKLPVYWDVR